MTDGATKGLDGDLDILQFSTPMYFVEKDEGVLNIDIMRLGHLTGEVRTQWFTMDGSAKAGSLYEEAAGEVVLGDGVSDASIQINIIRSTAWAPTLEFKVCLQRPDNCVLGKYLLVCRVKVIDKDVFPSAKYAKQISAGDEGIAQISGPGLLWEYVKLNANTPGMKRRTFLTLLFSQLANLYLGFTIYISIYLVDEFFAIPSGQQQHVETAFFGIDIKFLEWDVKQTAIATGIAYATPMLFVHLWEYIEIKFDILGRSRSLLQSCLFRKYLNYSEESRNQVVASDMQIAVLQDADEVAKSYLQVLHLSKTLGKLGVMAYFVALTNLGSIWILGAMCALMLMFGRVRNEVLSRASDRVNRKVAELGGLVADTCQRYRLVADYAQRPQVNERFQQMVQEYQKVDVPAEVVKLNNHWFPRWLGPIFIGIFIAIYAPKVFDGEGGITTGTFLASVAIFQLMSLDFEQVYKEILEINNSIVLLRGLTKYFNLPTDLLLWKSINRQRRESTVEARASALGGTRRAQSQMHIGGINDEEAFRSDTIPIKMLGMGFCLGTLQFQHVNLSVMQGRVVAVVGPHGSGKSTFLRLMAHTLFPDQGSIFVPTHLRILHVTQEPLLMNLSLWQNLNFGVPDVKNINPARVKLILERLKMHKTLELTHADMTAHPAPANVTDVVGWQSVLSYTEKVKIHIARALIMNAEVLVLQRPLHHFEATAAELILSSIKQHVQERGLAMPQGDARRHRRPRTVFFSPETVLQARQADVIWQVSKTSVSTSTVHMMVAEELRDGFERGPESTPMSLMNPTVALTLSDGRKSGRDGSNSKALSDQILRALG